MTPVLGITMLAAAKNLLRISGFRTLFREVIRTGVVFRKMQEQNEVYRIGAFSCKQYEMI